MTNNGTFLCETVDNASCTARANVLMFLNRYTCVMFLNRYTCVMFLNRYTCVIQSEMICPSQFLTMVGE